MIDYVYKPLVIGIAGGSASGKTTISNAIFEDLNKQALRGYIISIDDFYISITEEERENLEDIDFDDPKRIEFYELEAVLKNILDRKKTIIPIYDFKTCTRIGKKEINCNSIDFIIVEGLFCLYHPLIRNLLNVSIFIDTSDEVRWKRRLNRDVIERGADIKKLVTYYNKYVKPSYEKNILPTRKYADKILNDWNNNTFAKIINWLSSKFVLEAYKI